MDMVYNSIKDIDVTTRALAEVFGVTVDHINLLTVKHGLPRKGYNCYNLFEAYSWRVDYLKKEYDRRLAVRESAQDEVARKNSILKEFEIQKQAGNLLLKDDVYKTQLEVVRIFNQSLNNLAFILAPEVKGVDDVREIQVIVQREVNKIKTTISESL